MRLRNVILWILFIIAISVFLWYILGSSPTFEQTILILIITILFTIYTKISDMGSRLDNTEKRFNKLEVSFIKLVNDFKDVKEKEVKNGN